MTSAATPKSFLSDASHSSGDTSFTFFGMVMWVCSFCCTYLRSNFRRDWLAFLSFAGFPSIVMNNVLTAGHYLQIFQTIVHPIFVLMVNHFVWTQRTTKRLFHYVAVYGHFFIADGDVPSALVKPSIGWHIGCCAFLIFASSICTCFTTEYTSRQPHRAWQSQKVFAAIGTDVENPLSSVSYACAFTGAIGSGDSISVAGFESLFADRAGDFEVFFLALARTKVKTTLSGTIWLALELNSAIRADSSKVWTQLCGTFPAAYSFVNDGQSTINTSAITQSICVAGLTGACYNTLRHGASPIRTLCLEQPNGPSSRTAVRLIGETNPVVNSLSGESTV